MGSKKPKRMARTKPAAVAEVNKEAGSAPGPAAGESAAGSDSGDEQL